MKIQYQPKPEVNDFHNSGPISLRISGEKIWGMSGDVYRISSSQAQRIRKHFCNVKDCRCSAGSVEQLDSEGTQWGVPVRYCTGGTS